MWHSGGVNSQRPTPIEVVFRDAQPVDLDELGWSGGTAHQAVLADTLRASWDGEAVLVVGELPNQRIIAHGALDLRGEDPKIWLLAVHEAWRSLGVGSALLAELEHRAQIAGCERVWLSVEEDNPRARALYAARGYELTGGIVETWPLDDGTHYAAACNAMSKPVPPAV